MIGVGSVARDPFALPRRAENMHCSNSDPRGKTLRDPRLVPGKVTKVLIIAGQSLVCNYDSGGPYVPTRADKIDNLSIFDGGVYGASEPLLGPEGVGGHMPLRCADKLITAGWADRVVLVPCGMGGTRAVEWEPTGQYFERLIVAFARCASRGYSVDGVIWELGTSDNIANTSQAAWEASFSAMCGALVALGHTAPWLVGKSTWHPAFGGTDANIRAAQTAVVNGTTVFAGADTDTLTSATYRQQGDGAPHFTAAGSNAAATLWMTAIEAAL